jgi:hypothetical protein
MASPAPPPVRISIGNLHRQPGTPAASAAKTLQSVQHGLIAAAAAANTMTAGRLRLPALRIQLPPGVGALEITEAVRGAVAAALRRRRV